MNRSELKERIAPSRRGVLLERVIHADPKRPHHADGSPRVWAVQRAKEARAPEPGERALQYESGLLGRELDGLDRYAMAGPNAPRPFLRPPIIGAEEVAKAAQGFRDWSATTDPVIVNGAPGVLVRFPARSLLAAFSVSHGQIVQIYLIADPAKLRSLPHD